MTPEQAAETPADSTSLIERARHIAGHVSETELWCASAQIAIYDLVAALAVQVERNQRLEAVAAAAELFMEREAYAALPYKKLTDALAALDAKEHSDE